MMRFLITALVLILPVVFPGPASADALLAFVSGNVRVNGMAATSGHRVPVGATIETFDGKATVLIEEGNVIHLGRNSRLKLTDHTLSRAGVSERVRVELKYGKARALVKKIRRKKSFSIRARSVTMGVRGTQVLVDVPRDIDDPMEFHTVEGIARLTVSHVKGLVQHAPNLKFKGGHGGTQGVTETSVTLRSNEGYVVGERIEKKPTAEKFEKATLASIGWGIAPKPRELKTSKDIREYKKNPRPFADRDGGRPDFLLGGEEGGEEAIAVGAPIELPVDPIEDGGSDAVVNISVSVTKMAP